MDPTKPYLIRAIFDWCVDEGLTPYLLVELSDEVKVPNLHKKNKEIVLNISSSSAKKLIIDNDFISFSARFLGVLEDIFVPIKRVKSVYAFENGEGLFFDRICITGKQAKKTKNIEQEIKKPHLRIVK